MVRLSVLVLPFLVLACAGFCVAYKGLFVMTFGTKSHGNFFGAITKALARQGHEITFVSPYHYKFKDDNIKEITLTEDNEIKNLLGNAFALSNLELIRTMLRAMPAYCIQAVTNHQVAEALKAKYDYVFLSLFATECFLGYTYENKIPFIYASPNILISPYNARIGAPDFSSISPNKYTTITFPMSFSERVINTAVDMIVTVTTAMAVTRIESMCRETNLWSSDVPPAQELINGASLAVINSVRALEIPIRSTPPTIIYAGGIHIQKPKPLPKDIKDWLHGSGDTGFILFSLGTGAKPEDMKPEHLRSIINVFRSLDQRIIWKWDTEELEDLPPNIKLSAWLPQQDILAHPKIRLFITHGGLFSSQEATYFGVPILGMPIFGDQMSNVAEFEAEGWGRQLKWSDVNEDTFRSAVLGAMTNTSIRHEVLRRSKLMKDWPINPAEEVVYWVEYVVRHKGAKHLQSPLAHMTWYEIYNIDVWAFIIFNFIALLIVIFYTSKFCFKFLVKKLFKRKKD